MGKTGNQGDSRRTSVIRRVLVGTGGMVLLLVVTKVWVAPLVAANRIAFFVRRVCNGTVRVRGTRFGFDGGVRAGELLLTDGQGRPRLRAQDLRLNLSGLLSFDVYLSKLTVGSLKVDVYRDETEPWLRESRRPSQENRTLDVLVNDIVVNLHAGDSAATWVDDAHLSATRKQGVYEGSFRHGADPADGQIDVTGTLDPRSAQLQVHGRIDRALDANQTSVLLAWIDVPTDYGCEGRLDVEMRVEGSWRELTGLRTNGRVDFNDATVSFKGAPIVSNLRLACDVNDAFCLAGIEGRLLEGALRGTLSLEHSGLTVNRGRVSLEADGIGLEGLAERVPDWDSFTQGIASGHFDGTFDRLTLADVNGAGGIFVKDMDVHLLPIVSQVLEALDVVGADILGTSDAMIWFDNQGSMLTISDGSIANSINAIKAEPGGTVDLKTRQVDLYAVWVPIKQADSLLEALPLVDLLNNLKDKLIRVHVEGTWDQPPSQLVSKEPALDVSEGVIDFFEGVAKAGGKIPKAMFDALGSIGQ
ncbi:MAG: hypothetical protein JW993_13720 [Sedimentisphaerales bacterium]|nr:hypothetical protein [Sedimentisphaerales bacterium]